MVEFNPALAHIGAKLKEPIQGIKNKLGTRFGKRPPSPTAAPTPAPEPSASPPENKTPEKTQETQKAQPIEHMEVTAATSEQNEDWREHAEPAVSLMEELSSDGKKFTVDKTAVATELGGTATPEEIDAAIFLRTQHNEALEIFSTPPQKQTDLERACRSLVYFLEETTILGPTEPADAQGLNPRQRAEQALKQLAPHVTIGYYDENTNVDFANPQQWQDQIETETIAHIGADKWKQLSPRQQIAAKFKTDEESSGAYGTFSGVRRETATQPSQPEDAEAHKEVAQLETRETYVCQAVDFVTKAIVENSKKLDKKKIGGDPHLTHMAIWREIYEAIPKDAPDREAARDTAIAILARTTREIMNAHNAHPELKKSPGFLQQSELLTAVETHYKTEDKNNPLSLRNIIKERLIGIGITDPAQQEEWLNDIDPGKTFLVITALGPTIDKDAREPRHGDISRVRTLINQLSGQGFLGGREERLLELLDNERKLPEWQSSFANLLHLSPGDLKGLADPNTYLRARDKDFRHIKTTFWSRRLDNFAQRVFGKNVDKETLGVLDNLYNVKPEQIGKMKEQGLISLQTALVFMMLIQMGGPLLEDETAKGGGGGQ